MIASANKKGRVGWKLMTCAILVGLVATFWFWQNSVYRRGFTNRFVELRFHDSLNRNKLVYTLYVSGLGDNSAISIEPSRAANRNVDASIDIFEPSVLGLTQNRITFARNRISINERELPATPSHSVINQDGTVRVGAFLRRFD